MHVVDGYKKAGTHTQLAHAVLVDLHQDMYYLQMEAEIAMTTDFNGWRGR